MRGRAGKLQTGFAVTLAFGMLTSGCIEETVCRSVDVLAIDASRVTSIDIVDRSEPSRSSLPTTITDAAVIRDVLQTIQDPNPKWTVPIAGPPIGKISILMNYGADFVGRVTVGSTFLEGKGCGGFFIRDIATEERDALLGRLGMQWQG